MIKKIELPNKDFLPFVLEELASVPGKTVTLPLKGRSMRPFLEDGRDKALLKIDNNPAINDAVLAEISKGQYVLHRIVDMDGDRITLRGDGNINDEHCLKDDIRAKAIGFYRKGRQTPDLTDGYKWRLYSWWWTRLYPIRRYVLFALHPHIPQRLIKQKK